MLDWHFQTGADEMRFCRWIAIFASRAGERSTRLGFEDAVSLILPSVATGGVGYGPGSECLVSLTSQGFYTHVVRIMMRASGALEIGTDSRFKACVSRPKSRISLQRSPAFSDYSSQLTAIRSGERTIISVDNIKVDSAYPAIVGGGAKEVIEYVVPPLSLGDELHKRKQATVSPVLTGNQIWFEYLPRVQGISMYNVLFESERPDAAVRLVDPAKLLIQVDDAPTRKEWRSERPVAGALSVPRLLITTFGDWAKIAQQFRAAYFMDAQKLDDLQATGIQPVGNPEIVFKELVDRFGSFRISEPRIDPPSLASILQAKGGDCKALTFLLLNLLRWAGADAELVLVSEKYSQKLPDAFSLVEMDHVLVYVPSLNRYFDPMVPAGWQQLVRDQAIRIKDRFHVAGPPDGHVRPAGACADYCIVTGGRREGTPLEPIRVKTEKIRSYSSSRPETSRTPPQ